MGHGILNQKDPILPEDQFVCPAPPLEETHHGITHKNYVTVEQKAIGMSIRRGSVVALKDKRRRLYEEQIVEKSEGPERVVLVVNDYRYPAQFDKSANQIRVGDRAPCSPLPAVATCRFIRIAESVHPQRRREGVFSLDEVTLKKR